MLSVSASNGFQRSLATAAGDLTANAIQIVLAGLGLAAALNASKYGFATVKWLGVSYLVWLGASYIVIDGIFLCAYGKGGGWLGRILSSKAQVWVERFSGASLIGAALFLGLKSQRP